MRSLFVRVFGWLWLAIVLVAASAVIAIVIIRPPMSPGMPRLNRIATRMLAPQGRAAVEMYTQNGAEGLRGELEHWRINFYLFDDNGNEVTGRTVPDSIGAVARDVAREDKSRGERIDGQLCIAAPITDARGRHFVFVRSVAAVPPGAPWPPSPLVILLAEYDIVLFVLGAVFLVSGVLALTLTRQLTHPLRTLRNATRRLAGGDLSVRTAASIGPRRDEFGETESLLDSGS